MARGSRIAHRIVLVYTLTSVFVVAFGAAWLVYSWLASHSAPWLGPGTWVWLYCGRGGVEIRALKVDGCAVLASVHVILGPWRSVTNATMDVCSGEPQAVTVQNATIVFTYTLRGTLPLGAILVLHDGCEARVLHCYAYTGNAGRYGEAAYKYCNLRACIAAGLACTAIALIVTHAVYAWLSRCLREPG